MNFANLAANICVRHSETSCPSHGCSLHISLSFVGVAQYSSLLSQSKNGGATESPVVRVPVLPGTGCKLIMTFYWISNNGRSADDRSPNVYFCTLTYTLNVECVYIYIIYRRIDLNYPD